MRGKDDPRDRARSWSASKRTTADRAVRVMGWGAAGTVKVRALGNHQVDPEALQEAHAEANDQGMEVIAAG